MFKVKIQKRAIESISKVVEYISFDNIFYANKVQLYIYESIKLLESFPFLGIPKGKGYREIIESHYKFKIVYKIKGEFIYIVGLYREQKTWKQNSLLPPKKHSKSYNST